MKYCGIDLHSNNSVVSVIDDVDHVVAEIRLTNKLENNIGLMKSWRAELAGAVIESTFNWYWEVDGPNYAGFTAHPAPSAAAGTHLFQQALLIKVFVGQRQCRGCPRRVPL
jgi:hypothetical protein